MMTQLDADWQQAMTFSEHLLESLTLREKIMLLSSHGRKRFYSTAPIKRVGIPSFKMTDGPLGTAKHSNGFKKATRFPATICLASTWNRGLAQEMGVAIAKEVRAAGRHMILAPGMNIHRTPMCGRTFEYFSEDPFLTKELATPFVRGVQSQGVGACIKHFAANNQEKDRRSCNSVVDERTLHEIYLRAFEGVVRDADPWAAMACYNMVNGTYGCENRYLLQEVLFDKWGFNGFVMSDWFATSKIGTTEGCINAGLSLEMPSPLRYKVKNIERALSEGKITEERIDELVLRFLRVMYLAGAFESRTETKSKVVSTPEHSLLAKRIAEEGMVLLKNDGVLPLDESKLGKVCLLGPNLKKKFGRLLYGGSSAVVPPYEVTPLQAMQERMGSKIVSNPKDADVVLLFLGLDHGRGKDSETADRKEYSLPKKQIELIKDTVSENPNTIAVVIAGSPVSMVEWIDDVPAVLMAWYGGMEAGHAISNLLFGDIVPSGHLPITFPKKIEDSPAHHTGDPRNYPGDENKNVYYDEGIYVGYRWYEKKGIDPLFPFGYGLSYADLEIMDVTIDKTTASPGDEFKIDAELRNNSSINAGMVVQVYASAIDSSVDRPPRELVGFEKASLKPQEGASIPITIRSTELSYYDIIKHDWNLENGLYEFQIGLSSQNIIHTLQVRIE